MKMSCLKNLKMTPCVCVCIYIYIYIYKVNNSTTKVVLSTGQVGCVNVSQV